MLGAVIFVGFGLSLALGSFSDKLLSPDFYRNIIVAEDTYNRIYVEVLVDDALNNTTAEFVGNIKVANHQEIVALVREIAPPEYIQGQVEDSIARTVDYFNEDVDYLDVYVDLTKPLENVKPVMFAYLDQKIDELEVVDPGTVSCSLDGTTNQKLADVAVDYMTEFLAMSGGEIPVAAPSLNALQPLCRQLLFVGFYDQLLASTDLPVEASQPLRDQRERLQGFFESGDTLAMLKVASRLLTEPLIDAAIVQIRQDLIDGYRFDVIRQLAEWSDSSSEAQLRIGISGARDQISKAQNLGNAAALTMVFGGSVLMGLVFFPALSSMLRWPGIALSTTGLFFFVVSKISERKVPDALAGFLESSVKRTSDVPPSVSDLGGDILISFGSQLTTGFAGQSLNLMILGAVIMGGSFFRIIINRFLPSVR